MMSDQNHLEQFGFELREDRGEGFELSAMFSAFEGFDALEVFVQGMMLREVWRGDSKGFFAGGGGGGSLSRSSSIRGELAVLAVAG
jgi:hypothetical protein